MVMQLTISCRRRSFTTSSFMVRCATSVRQTTSIPLENMHYSLAFVAEDSISTVKTYNNVDKSMSSGLDYMSDNMPVNRLQNDAVFEVSASTEVRSLSAPTVNLNSPWTGTTPAWSPSQNMKITGCICHKPIDVDCEILGQTANSQLIVMRGADAVTTRNRQLSIMWVTISWKSWHIGHSTFPICHGRIAEIAWNVMKSDKCVKIQMRPQILNGLDPSSIDSFASALKWVFVANGVQELAIQWLFHFLMNKLPVAAGKGHITLKSKLSKNWKDAMVGL